MQIKNSFLRFFYSDLRKILKNLFLHDTITEANLAKSGQANRLVPKSAKFSFVGIFEQ